MTITGHLGAFHRPAARPRRLRHPAPPHRHRSAQHICCSLPPSRSNLICLPPAPPPSALSSSLLSSHSLSSVPRFGLHNHVCPRAYYAAHDLLAYRVVLWYAYVLRRALRASHLAAARPDSRACTHKRARARTHARTSTRTHAQKHTSMRAVAHACSARRAGAPPKPGAWHSVFCEHPSLVCGGGEAVAATASVTDTDTAAATACEHPSLVLAMKGWCGWGGGGGGGWQTPTPQPLRNTRASTGAAAPFTRRPFCIGRGGAGGAGGGGAEGDEGRGGVGYSKDDDDDDDDDDDNDYDDDDDDDVHEHAHRHGRCP